MQRACMFELDLSAEIARSAPPFQPPRKRLKAANGGVERFSKAARRLLEGRSSIQPFFRRASVCTAFCRLTLSNRFSGSAWRFLPNPLYCRRFSHVPGFSQIFPVIPVLRDRQQQWCVTIHRYREEHRTAVSPGFEACCLFCAPVISAAEKGAQPAPRPLKSCHSRASISSSTSALKASAAPALLYGRPAVTPPSTGRTVPVIHEAFSEARNRIASATSAGWPFRPSG